MLPQEGPGDRGEIQLKAIAVLSLELDCADAPSRQPFLSGKCLSMPAEGGGGQSGSYLQGTPGPTGPDYPGEIVRGSWAVLAMKLAHCYKSDTKAGSSGPCQS